MVATHAGITLGQPRREVRLPGLRLVEVAYAPGRALAAHAHASANVSLVLEGGFEETTGDRRDRAGSCSVVVKPAGTVHSNRFGPLPSRSLIIEVTPLRERRLLGAGSLGPPRWVHHGPAAAAALRLYRAFVDAPDDLEARVVRGLREIIERSRPPAAPPASTGILRRAESILRAGLERPPTVRAVADAVGVHPVHLARLFRAAHGCGVAAFRRRLQVFDAARRLVAPSARAAWVAHDCGFADQSHLCRAFRRETGMTPGGFRRLVRGL